MFSFNIGGFGLDESGAEVALGVVHSDSFDNSPKCLFGLAVSDRGDISLDLFWIRIL